MKPTTATRIPCSIAMELVLPGNKTAELSPFFPSPLRPHLRSHHFRSSRHHKHCTRYKRAFVSQIHPHTRLQPFQQRVEIHHLPDHLQSVYHWYHPAATMRRDVSTAPGAMLRAPVTVFDRSTSQFVRPMRPSRLRRSRSALNVRAPSSDFSATLRVIENRLAEVPGAWHASGPYLYWPRLPQNLSQSASPLNPHTVSTPRWASVTRPRSDSDRPNLVSLADIATRFGLARDRIHTINACSYRSDTLKFIVLDETDGWIHDRHALVYAKTNLHLLPGHELPYPDHAQEALGNEYDGYSESDLIDLRSRAGSPTSLRVELSSPTSVVSTAPSSVRSNNVQIPPGDVVRSLDLSPVALFARVRPGQQGRVYEFLGWYDLEETEFFAPRTFELFRMHGERYAWRSTPSGAVMQCEWAKIRLVRQEESGVSRWEEAPQVDRTRDFSHYD